MDGHILITCGAIMMLCFSGLKTVEPWAYFIVIACALSLVVYCAMIWPFLKSVGMMTLSLGVVVITLIAFFTRSSW